MHLRKFIVFNYHKIKSLNIIENISDHYKICELLGQGSFGQVRKATHVKLGIECAVKIIKKVEIFPNETMIENLENELLVL